MQLKRRLHEKQRDDEANQLYLEMLEDDFVKLFLASTISHRMENGEPTLIAGKSGIEIAREIVYETTGQEITNEAGEHFGRSREYWIGWALAYYQWYSSRKYSEIFKLISFEELQQMYYTLHEADISKFVSIADALKSTRLHDGGFDRKIAQVLTLPHAAV